MTSDSSLFDGLALAVLQRLGEWPTGRVLLVTSARPGEGKTFIARRLAKTVAAMGEGRVLLVDANAENPSLAKAFAPGAAGSDLFDSLRSGSLLSNGIQSTLMPSLYALPAAPSKARGHLLFHMDAMGRVLDALRRSFALTILDGGTLAQAGCLPLQADATIVVVDATRTRRDIVRGALDSPQVDRTKIMGVVLNRRPEYVPRWIYRSLL